jgi:hypothetical protein
MTQATYIRVYADDDGESHFADCDMQLESFDYAPPAPPLLLSAINPGSGVLIMSCEPGWSGDWHPGPRRQWMFWLSGATTIEVSDGEVRTITAGTILLSEDTSGKGHRSWDAGQGTVLIAIVPIPDA